ncbi:acyl transferase [Spirosoma sp. 209]|uniref:acyl transferase n=1 Tax=Spirosoma sp. 209 TaxID=1955701 RepID=UPI00098D74BD|nr:acyl transferase [Spirosoma sp. 209]
MSLLSTLSADVAARRARLRQQILTVTPDSFESLALAVFRYQAEHNPIYRQYLHYLHVRPEQTSSLREVPFMPIGFFRNHTILTGVDPRPDLLADTLTFASSGTTGAATSRHYVPDPALYDAVSTRIFEQLYGPLRNVTILALLPSYLERNNSSLVYMVQRFMAQTNADQSGFFLNDFDALTTRLHQLLQRPAHKTLLIGVTFGLLDWAESRTDVSLADYPNLIVMETGGMKGRRKELLREEVHDILTSRTGVPIVHSEYGMTELLSQAYSLGQGVFSPSPTLRVLLRDINDPFTIYPAADAAGPGARQSGGINVIDLANLDSCSFLETQDLGQYVGADGHFRVIGRFDNSDVRGCNLMVL